MKTIKLGAVAIAALALAILAAACGGGGGSAAASPYGASGSTSSPSSYGGGSGGSASALTVKTASSPLGTILVDQDGKTLYLFEADHGPVSTCSGGCATVWPAATTSGSPTAGAGASAGMLGTTKRADGTMQATYGGHPLYWYAGDTKAGDTNGEGLTDFGGAWYAVSPAGQAVEESGS
jgi:predicted lipoprotein with Yx(FWY)xxD motif